MVKRHRRRADAIRNAQARTGDGARPSPSAPLPQAVPHGPPTAATSAEPPREVQDVGTPEAARALGQRLLSGSLTWPVVVVTIPSGLETPYIDVDQLLRDVRGLAELVVLPTGGASWAFSEVMPSMTQVYGGAGRVYATDLRWVANPYASPLRFAYSRGEGAPVAELLADDVVALTLHSAPTETRVVSIPASGAVLGAIGSRAIVSLDDGGIASIWAELTVPGVPAAQLFTKNQPVQGWLDPESRRLDVRLMVEAASAERNAQSLSRADAQHVLVRVEQVGRDGLTVATFPNETVDVPWSLAGGRAHREFYEPGDVVVATWWVEGERQQLRLDLWTDGESIEPAPAVLPGGPPWLVLADPADVASAVALESHGNPAEVDPNDPIQVERAGMERELRELRQENRKLRDERRELRRRAQTAGRGTTQLSAEDSFRYLVYAAWTGRLLLDDRKRYPLRDFHLSPRFLDSARALEGFSLNRIADVAMEVVTTLAREMDGRDLHELRTSAAGGSPQRIDPETGAAGWRVALQRGAASARRMHYWENKDNTVTLERVVIHDKFAP